jgi:hypothetical protein
MADGKTVKLDLRVDPEWLAEFDSWRAAQPVPPSRAEAIRVAVARLIGTKADAGALAPTGLRRPKAS